MRAGEQFTYRCEQTAISRRVGARCPPDRALADFDNAIDVFETRNLLVWGRIAIGPIQFISDGLIQGVVNERGLAGTRYTSHAGHQTEWYRCLNVLQIITAGTDNNDLALGIADSTFFRKRDNTLARQVLSGQ